MIHCTFISGGDTLGHKNTDEALRNFDDYLGRTITLRDKNDKVFNIWDTSNYYWVNKFDDKGGKSCLTIWISPGLES